MSEFAIEVEGLAKAYREGDRETPVLKASRRSFTVSAGWMTPTPGAWWWMVSISEGWMRRRAVT